MQSGGIVGGERLVSGLWRGEYSCGRRLTWMDPNGAIRPGPISARSGVKGGAGGRDRSYGMGGMVGIAGIRGIRGICGT